jgi:hypothetical protein
MRNKTSSKKLNKAYIEFGEPTLFIIQECEQALLNEVEDKFIQEYGSCINGFNTAAGAVSGPKLFGESHPNSTISNNLTYEILVYLINNSTLTIDEVSKIFGLSYAIIRHIFQGDRHRWLSREFPDEYSKLELLRLNKKGSMYKSIKYPGVVDAFKIIITCPDIPFKEISEFLNISLDTINSISKANGYTWLAEEFPLEYKLLLSQKGSRGKHLISGEKISAMCLGIQYPPILSPSGEVYTVNNVSAFAREHTLDKSTLHRVLTGRALTHKGWKICPKEQVF